MKSRIVSLIAAGFFTFTTYAQTLVFDPTVWAAIEAMRSESKEIGEKQEKADVVKRLGFSKCRLSLAIPKAIDYKGVEWFEGKKIATSYPEILRIFSLVPGVRRTGSRAVRERPVPALCGRASL